MIAFLRGTPVEFNAQSVLLDVQGVGYEVLLSERHRLRLQNTPPTELTLLTWLSHREDSMELFGFESQQEKNLFLDLNRVSGVGLRTALTLISALTAPELIQAICQSQVKTLCKAPGIGQKTAQRIILELREKLLKAYPLIAIPGPQIDLPPETREEVESTLLALGYRPEEIESVWSQLPAEKRADDADQLLRLLLTQLSS